MRIQGHLPHFNTEYFQLGNGVLLETFDQGQVRRPHAGQLLGQGRFGRAAQLVHDGVTIGRSHHHFGCASQAQTGAILVRRLQCQVMVTMLDQIDTQATRRQLLHHILQQGSLATARTAYDAQYRVRGHGYLHNGRPLCRWVVLTISAAYSATPYYTSHLTVSSATQPLPSPSFSDVTLA